MLRKLVAMVAALEVGVALLPSPPPTTKTAIVFRHWVSPLMRRVTSDFKSVSRFASGASVRPEPSLPS